MKDGCLIEEQAPLADLDRNLRREAAARDLAQAIAACDPDDRLQFIEWVHEFLCAGWPDVPFGSVMEHASFWAASATRAEHKAYTLACFRQLSHADQAAFLRHVQNAGPV